MMYYVPPLNGHEQCQDLRTLVRLARFRWRALLLLVALHQVLQALAPRPLPVPSWLLQQAPNPHQLVLTVLRARLQALARLEKALLQA